MTSKPGFSLASEDKREVLFYVTFYFLSSPWNIFAASCQPIFYDNETYFIYYCNNIKKQGLKRISNIEMKWDNINEKKLKVFLISEHPDINIHLP